PISNSMEMIASSTTYNRCAGCGKVTCSAQLVTVTSPVPPEASLSELSVLHPASVATTPSTPIIRFVADHGRVSGFIRLPASGCQVVFGFDVAVGHKVPLLQRRA